MRGSLSGTLATMGNGVPYMVGAKFGHPDRPAIAFVGDGAMQMNGINELITIAKYWQEWTDPRLIVAVLHNHDLNQVTWEMRAMEGAPQFLPSQELPAFPYAGYARSLGLEGIRVDDPNEIAPAWRQGTRRGPAVRAGVHYRPRRTTDPAARDARPDREHDLSSVVRGDSDRWDVIKEGVKLKAQEFLPGGRPTEWRGATEAVHGIDRHRPQHPDRTLRTHRCRR